jgi:hypothetical protein
LSSLPQQKTSLVSVAAHAELSPTLTETTVPLIGTVEGISAVSFRPSDAPRNAEPQHRTAPAVSMAQVLRGPAEIATNFIAKGGRLAVTIIGRSKKHGVLKFVV